MFTNFTINLCKKIAESDFVLSDSLTSDEIISDNTKVIAFSKMDGATFYGVFIFNGSSNVAAAIENIKKTQSHLIDSVKNFIILSIIIAEKIDDEVKLLLENSQSFYDQKIYEIFWVVSLKEHKLIVSKKQPDKILNIHKLIRESFKSDSNSSDGIIKNFINPVQSKRQNKWSMSILLICINAVILIATLFNDSGSYNPIIQFGAIHPGLIIEQHQYYRLFTSMFLHIGWMHFAYNALSLYIFGSRIESHLSKMKFLIIYFASGIVASIFSVLLTNSIALGASGAVFGLIGASASYAKVTGKSLEGLNFYIIIIFIILGMGTGMLETNVDSWAHFGGLIAGVLLGLIMFRRSK